MTFYAALGEVDEHQELFGHPQCAAQPVQSQPDTPEHAETGISGAGHRPNRVLSRPQRGELLLR